MMKRLYRVKLVKLDQMGYDWPQGVISGLDYGYWLPVIEIWAYGHSDAISRTYAHFKDTDEDVKAGFAEIVILSTEAVIIKV